MLRWVQSCPSTQDILAKSTPEVTAVATLDQTKGRGRRGRAWQSAMGSSLALSWRAPVAMLDVASLPLISLAAGVALYRWVSKVNSTGSHDYDAVSQLHLKWPNDLLFEKRKIAGILCEGRIDQAGQSVLVGIGLNLSKHPSFPPMSSSLDEVISTMTEYDHFKESWILEKTPQLIVELERSVHELISKPNDLLDRWRRYGLPLGEPLKAAGYVGRYGGINDQGALLLDIGQRVISVEGGEVNLISSIPNQ